MIEAKYSVFGITRKNRNDESGRKMAEKKTATKQSIIYDANTHHLELNGTHIQFML